MKQFDEFFVLISFFAGNGKSTLKVTFSEEDLLQQDMSEQLEKDKANVRQNDSEFCRFVSMELYALETRQTQFLRFLKFRYSQKATKFWRNLPICLTLLTNVTKIGRFF